MASTENPTSKPHRNPIWLVLAALGTGAFWLALDFGFGSAANIGSAVFPLALSGIVVAISAWSFAFPRPEAAPPLAWRPLLTVSGSVILFILLIERAGMFPTVVLCMLLAYAAQTERGYPVFVAYAAIFAAGAWVLFSYLLGMPVPFVDFG